MEQKRKQKYLRIKTNSGRIIERNRKRGIKPVQRGVELPQPSRTRGRRVVGESYIGGVDRISQEAESAETPRVFSLNLTLERFMGESV